MRRSGQLFLPTPSARRATGDLRSGVSPLLDFYPRPPRGGRPRQGAAPLAINNFYPRPPRGGRPQSGEALS